MERVSVIPDRGAVLVDFFATWCEPCKWAEPVLEKVISYFDGKLQFRKIDVDHFPELANDLSVSGVPTLVLFINGREVWRMRGFAVPSEMIQAISPLLVKTA
ncbi:MAG: thioredoxin family protein [Bacteroidia bacterium]|nr:thioredoxin family protein [Bacteroidia bacterium]